MGGLMFIIGIGLTIVCPWAGSGCWRELHPPVCLPVRTGVRRHRIYRRLSEGEAPPEHRPDRAAEVYSAAGGGGGLPVPDALRGDAEPQPVYSLLEHPSVLPWVVYLVFAAFVIVGTVNAVNITDGLDGLSSSVTVPVALFFAGDGRPVARLRAAGAVLRGHGGRSAGLPVSITTIPPRCSWAIPAPCFWAAPWRRWPSPMICR